MKDSQPLLQAPPRLDQATTQHSPHVHDEQQRREIAPADYGETAPVVFVVDDDEAARESVCALVAAMDVDVEAFASATEFLASYDGHQPGCLVTDVRMAGISGLELQRKLNRANVRLPVVIVSAYIDVRGTVVAMTDGAVTVLSKPYEEQRLWDAIQRGLKLCIRWLGEDKRQVDLLNRLAELTDGEREVLDLVVDGAPNKAVGRRLGISIRTVEDRRARIMKKLRVHSFAALLHLVHEARAIKERTSIETGSYIA
ncbi:MAG: response regulator transcription factor [Planctomycetes bacterium]|nr:response regulator transcription factor [Planctomycetota bacterium]